MKNAIKKGIQVLKVIFTAFAGVVAGFLIGHSALGEYFPGLISAAFLACSALAVLAALGIKTRLPEWKGTDRFLFALLVCSLALSSSISAGCMHMQYDWGNRMAGFMPVSDPMFYFWDVMDWPDRQFNIMSSRRPLNPVLQILEFHLGGSSLLGMYLIRAMLAAMAIAAFATSLSRLAGNWAAWAVTTLLLYWAWPYASMVMTETNGITLSAAGFALAFHGLASRDKKHLLFWALAGLSLAMAFRPHNPISSPLFAFSLAFLVIPSFKRKLAVGLALSAFTILLPLTMEKFIYSQYGTPLTSLQGNSGAILLGLARGTDWMEANNYIRDNFPELSASSNGSSSDERIYDEKKINEKMLEILWPVIRENPLVLLNRLKEGFAQSVDGFYFYSFKAAGLEKVAYRFWEPLKAAFYLGVIASLLLLYRSRIALLLALSLFSFFSFSPVLYAVGDYRVAASLYPGLALVAVLIPFAARKCKDWLSGKVETDFNTSSGPDLSGGLRVAQSLILLVFLSIPYALISGRVLSQREGKGHSHAFTLAVEAGKSPGWTGVNSAVVSPEYVRQWFEMGARDNYAGMKENADFIGKHGQSIRALLLEPGNMALVLKDSAAFRAFPAISKPCPWCPPLKLRVQEAPK